MNAEEKLLKFMIKTANWQGKADQYFEHLKTCNQDIIKRLDKINGTNESQEKKIAKNKAKVDFTVNKIKDYKNFATKDEVLPLKRIIYGVITLILLGFFGTLLAFVFKQANFELGL
jgi:ASC-1-like (ASCH) protein